MMPAAAQDAENSKHWNLEQFSETQLLFETYDDLNSKQKSKEDSGCFSGDLSGKVDSITQKLFNDSRTPENSDDDYEPMEKGYFNNDFNILKNFEQSLF